MSGLTIDRMSAGYGPMQVIHDVSLEVRPGEKVGLLGLNGHGKTTLMRSIVGLTEWQRGSIKRGDREISGMPTYAVAQSGVVMIPQGDAIFPGLSVRDNLDSGARRRQAWRARAELRDRVLEVFPQLRSRLDQPAGTLSGGERRMVSIGRGLMADGDVYLVDEPSVGLAPGLAMTMIEMLFSLDLGDGAMLLAEQNRALIESDIDRIVRLHGGRIVDDGGPGTSINEIQG